MFDLITVELPDGSTVQRWKKSGDIYLRHEKGNYNIYGSLNVTSLPDNSFEIISNFDAETGIGQYENTFVIVDGACFEEIEELMIAKDFEAAAKGFQSIIMSDKAKSLVMEPQK